MSFSNFFLEQSAGVLTSARAHGLHITTAESCTGGLIAALLTEIPGSSDVFERGFVTYTNIAKQEMLGVPPETLQAHGAVSRQTAKAMAEGALAHSHAELAVAVTGIAGPGGGTAQKPIGLVYLATAMKGEETIVKECRFGDPSREHIRLRTVKMALTMLRERIAIWVEDSPA